MPSFYAVILGSAATGCETLAAIAVFHPDSTAIYHCVAFHIAAVVSCTAAARCRASQRGVEEEAVVITALFVPLFGPSLAWMFPNEKNPEVLVNAHAYFERFEDLARRAEHGLGCLPDGGAPGASQPYPLSFAEILRHGSIAHKRNALTKLAELGGPCHFQMLRRVMVVEDGELRLCAYIELRRLARRYEDRIAELQDARLAVANPEDELRLAASLAGQHYELAASGLLDPEMERYHAQKALAAIDKLWRERPDHGPTARIRARVMSYLGDTEEALAGLELLSDSEQTNPETRLIRAEIAFRMRDLEVVRREATELTAEGSTCPEWMTVLQPKPEERTSDGGEEASR